ncbi:MBL fold metallo-hydrolase, partial [Candidatus Sumerlaeota bacterium]|nr:MBL fold metallo-hydrolase [Candidatus Sumerlaeota bacterium]
MALLTAVAVAMAFSHESQGQERASELKSTGKVTLEFIAHACFIIDSPAGVRVMIDPYGLGTGYPFPNNIDVDLILVTHDHYDHNGAALKLEAPMVREPEVRQIGDIRIEGLLDRHVPGYGVNDNIIWVVETGGLRIVHLGDNQIPSSE